MLSSFQKFKSLHENDELFVLPNAWDARSAVIFQENEFSAVATSSAAVANALGYEDGENMSFSEYLFVIGRIKASVQVPLTVDLEMGYGETKEQIYANLQRLCELGVVGINIEDSAIESKKRTLRDAGSFAKTIEYLKNKLESENQDLFINLRCDTYILNVDNKAQVTLNRLAIYEEAGADGIFLPCITREEDIAEAVAHTRLPLNVMCIPGLPSIEKLNELGVKRVSMGPFMFHKVYGNIGQVLKTINLNQNFLVLV